MRKKLKQRTGELLVHPLIENICSSRMYLPVISKAVFAHLPEHEFTKALPSTFWSLNNENEPLFGHSGDSLFL